LPFGGILPRVPFTKEKNMKKLLLTAAAVAMPMGIIASAAGASAAPKPTIDVSNASITCTSVVGLLKFSPPLKIGATGDLEKTGVRLDLGGCTVSGTATPVTIISGKGHGTLHSASTNAASLLGPDAVSGFVTINWKTRSKLTLKQSVVFVSEVTGGAPSDGYLSVAVNPGNASVGGDFTGGDGGANSSMYAESTQTLASLQTAATPPNLGIKSINLGTGPTHTTPNSLTLG
jgi:hypothetical protein